MSAQRETTSESESERFAPEGHEQVSDAPDSSLAAIESDDDRLDWLARQAGTTVCGWCGARKPVADIESCENERERADGTRNGRCRE